MERDTRIPHPGAALDRTLAFGALTGLFIVLGQWRLLLFFPALLFGIMTLQALRLLFQAHAAWAQQQRYNAHLEGGPSGIHDRRWRGEKYAQARGSLISRLFRGLSGGRGRDRGW